MRCETLGLLCRLLDMGADEHWVTPPRKELHDLMVLDRRNYSHAIEELEALGIVVRDKYRVRVTLGDYDTQYIDLFVGNQPETDKAAAAG
jgi:hypothetical protein